MVGAVSGQCGGGAHREEIVGSIADQSVEIRQHVIAESRALDDRAEPRELVAPSLPSRPQLVER